MGDVSLTSVSLILAFLGVVATIVAPRLGRRSRLFTEVERVESALPEAPTKSIRLEVYHNEKRISTPIGVASILIENTGSRDITESEFVTPIEIRIEKQATPLSAEIDAPDGAYVVVDLNESSALVRWAILKPGERVRVRLAFTGPRPVIDNYKDIVKVLARLKDVRMGEGWRPYTPLLKSIFLILFVLPAFFLFLSVSRQHLEKSFIINSHDSLSGYILSEGAAPGSEYSACKAQRHPFTFAECVEVTFSQYRHYFSSASKGARYTGIPISAIWTIPLLAVTFAIMLSIAYAGQISARVWRAATRLFATSGQ